MQQTLFNQFGRTDEMDRTITLYTKSTNRLATNTPPEAYIDIAGLYAQAGLFDKMANILKSYLVICPNE
jgi:hypothetical protein